MDGPVLLISHGFQPNYEKAFANGLAHNGIPVELIGSDRTLYSELFPAVKSVNLRGSQDPKRPRLVKAFTLLRYFVKLFAHIYSKRPRVLHLNGLLLGGVGPMALVELVLYRFGSKKLWLTVHNIVPHDKHAETNRLCMRLLYRIPHLLVTHTNNMKRDLMYEFGVPASRIVVMEHGVDEVPATAAQPSPGANLKVLMFGGVMPYKGLDIFLRSLPFCRDVAIEATIAGESRNIAYAVEIERMISEVASPHRVSWIRGFIPECEVQSYFEQADVVVMPYRHIDQSGVLFTAFRFGTPVVCFDVGAFRGYVPDFAGIVVPSQTAQALANGLCAFFKNIGNYDRQAIQTYARSFSWESTVRVLLPYMA